MKITKELIKTIYGRVSEYAEAKYGKKLSDIEFYQDGKIYIIFREYVCGDVEVDSFEVDLTELTESLDVLHAKRLERERIQLEEEAKRREAERIQREERDKRNRYAEYLKLKKEFENPAN